MARASALLAQRPPAQQAQPTLSPAAVMAEYLGSLQRQADNEVATANSSTLAAASRAAQEFSSWLAARSVARGVTLHNCSPDDLTVYLESAWLPQHGSLLLADGQVHAAASYLATTISHLSGLFKRLGRNGPYDDNTQKGNPCLHSSVNALKSSHRLQLWALGYAERSAKSVSYEKLTQVLRQLHTEASSGLGPMVQNSGSYRFRAALPMLLLLRDGLAISWAWAFSCRAHSCGTLTLADVQDRQGQLLRPQLLQSKAFPYPEGFQWQFAPNGSKTMQQRRAGSLPFQVLPASEGAMDPLRWLHIYVQVCTWAGVPTSGPLLRPLADQQDRFKEEPLKTDNINKRLQHHLKRLGLFAGESTHGLRRGSVIHQHQQLGRSAAEVGARLQHADPGGRQTLEYLDTSRETGAPRRQRPRRS